MKINFIKNKIKIGFYNILKFENGEAVSCKFTYRKKEINLMCEVIDKDPREKMPKETSLLPNSNDTSNTMQPTPQKSNQKLKSSEPNETHRSRSRSSGGHHSRSSSSSQADSSPSTPLPSPPKIKKTTQSSKKQNSFYIQI